MEATLAEHALEHAVVVVAVDAANVGLGVLPTEQLFGERRKVFRREHAFEWRRMRTPLGRPGGHLERASDLIQVMHEISSDADVFNAGYVDDVLQMIGPGCNGRCTFTNETRYRGHADDPVFRGDRAQKIIG